MSKPIIKQISPFDAAKEAYIEFVWTGIRCNANRIVVYDNTTNASVYDNTVTSYALRHKIPANTLQNGKKYNVQIYVTDINDNTSSASDKVLFYTLSTPTFVFEDIHDKDIVKSSSLTAYVHYYSADWEDLTTYTFYLYDSTKKLILTTDSFTDQTNLSYTYRGLNNDSIFYIQCKAITVNGMELDTGLVEIYVRYENQSEYSRIYAEPMPKQGCIKVSTNIVIIQYNGTEDFTYENGMINLIDKILYYDEGFIIPDDFTLIIRGKNLWQTAEIFKAKNADEMGFSISSRIYPDNKLRFKLTVPNGVGNYILYSEPLEFGNDNMVTLAVRRINDVYQIYVWDTEEYSDVNNWWWGTERPSQALTQDSDAWVDTSEYPTIKVDKANMKEFIQSLEPEFAQYGDLWIGGE